MVAAQRPYSPANASRLPARAAPTRGASASAPCAARPLTARGSAIATCRSRTCSNIPRIRTRPGGVALTEGLTWCMVGGALYTEEDPMSNRGTKNLLIALIAATVLCAAGLALAAKPTAEPAGGTIEPLGAACDAQEALNYTPALQPENPAGWLEELQATETAARCKACKDRPFCHCTYNGLPRVSCNPCCYGNLGIPQVCLD